MFGKESTCLRLSKGCLPSLPPLRGLRITNPSLLFLTKRRACTSVALGASGDDLRHVRRVVIADFTPALAAWFSSVAGCAVGPFLAGAFRSIGIAGVVAFASFIEPSRWPSALSAATGVKPLQALDGCR